MIQISLMSSYDRVLFILKLFTKRRSGIFQVILYRRLLCVCSLLNMNFQKTTFGPNRLWIRNFRLHNVGDNAKILELGITSST